MTHGVCVFVCVQFKLHPRATDSLQATVLWVERTRGRRGRLPPPAGRPDQERILQPPEIQRHWAVRLGKQEVTSSPIKTLRTSCRVVSFRHFSRPLLCRKRGAPTHTNKHRYLWSTFATGRYRNCAQLMFQCKYSVGVCDLYFIFPPLFRDSVCAYRVSPSHSKMPNVWKDKKHKRNVNTSLEAISNSWRRHIFILPFWTEEKFMNLKHSNAN